MKISVVIPTFNRCFIIAKTLDSLQAQTYKNFGTTIIDDGSTDTTTETVQPYLNKHIRYIKMPHKGTPYIWNFGVKKSKQNYVLLMGDDVALDQNCLKNLTKALKTIDQKRLGAIAPRLIYTADSHHPKERKADKKYAYIDPCTGDIKGSFNVEADKILEVSILHGYSLVRKEAFLDVGGFDQKTYKGNYYREETDLWLRMKKKGYKLYYEPEAKIYCQKSLTKGGQWSNVGGNPLTYEYYVIRNHKEFLKKFYGKERFFMLPTFIIRRLYIGSQQIHAHIQNR